MPAGVTLLDMTTDLRATLGYSMNIAHGVDQQPALYAALRRTQVDLWQMHDWPQLNVQVDKACPTGMQRVAIPEDLDFEHLNDVYARSVGAKKREKLIYGIGPDEYSVHDSLSGERGSPIQNWAYAGEDDQPNNTIEVWPIPSADHTLTFAGRRALLPLVAETDVCTLDSELIIAHTAAQLMLRNKDPTAQLQLNKAQSLLNRLRARQGANKRRPFLIVSRL